MKYVRSHFWGVFRTDEDLLLDNKRQHVAPCDEDGVLREPHILFDGCPCHPEMQGTIVVHQEIQ